MTKHPDAPQREAQLADESRQPGEAEWQTPNFRKCGERRFLGSFTAKAALGIWVLGYMGTCGAVLCGAAEQPSLIPAGALSALEQELEQGATGTSTVEVRMACKRVARQASALLEASPEAPNRYAVLAVLFQSQKRLLRLEATERNRNALFETAGKLLDAPAAYAATRLEADLLLSEADLSARGATLGERAEALAELLARYRGTAVEAKSLMMAALIVQKLEAPGLERAIQDAMRERFSDDHEVIAFRRTSLKISQLYVTFKGEFNRNDGTAIRFPADTMGHLSLMVFWSNTPGVATYLAKTKEALAKASGLVDVFSFNLDELADGGASILEEHGLDWTVMHLPGGRRHSAYRAYAHGNPVAVLVNEYGLSVIEPEVAYGLSSELNPASISEARYMAQLQSLFIGEFLVPDPHPASSLQAIQECFVPPPFRYRLTREEALANYGKAAALCDDVLKGGGDAGALRHVRDRRIIALLGMWNLARDSTYLEMAVKEAQAMTAPSSSPGLAIVPRFCLAKHALRDGEADANDVLSDFLEACGGDDAPAAAVAAAAILALEAGSRERHETYRDRFLATHAGDAKLYAFASFLRDMHHRYRLLKPNHTQHGVRSYIVANGGAPMTSPFPGIELKTLDGGNLSLPKDTNGKLTFMLFVEPPPPGGSVLGGGVRAVMGYANKLTMSHVNEDINFVAAFLTDDADHVRRLVETNSWSCTPAMVPGGLANPMVRQLGILSADHYPNVFLLRRDGTIAFHTSGLDFKNVYGGLPFALLLSMKVNVEVCDVAYAYRALVAGDFQTAQRTFAGPYLPWGPDRFGWRSPRYHGRALAYMGLKDWDAALESIDTAILAHTLRHLRGRRRSKPEDWRREAASVVMDAPCDILAMQWRAKAEILEALGRSKEAASVRQQADGPVQPDHPGPYNAFHEKLGQWQQHRKIEL